MTLPKDYVIRFSDNDISLENTRLVMTMIGVPHLTIRLFYNGRDAGLIFVRNHKFMVYSVHSFHMSHETIINFSDWI